MAQADVTHTTINPLLGPNIVRFPTQAAADRFIEAPAFQLRRMAENDTHIVFAMTVSREMLAANMATFAVFMNAATGL